MFGNMDQILMILILRVSHFPGFEVTFPKDPGLVKISHSSAPLTELRYEIKGKSIVPYLFIFSQVWTHSYTQYLEKQAIMKIPHSLAPLY